MTSYFLILIGVTSFGLVKGKPPKLLKFELKAKMKFIVTGDYAWYETKDGYEGLINVGSYDFHVCLEECIYLDYCNVVSFDNSTNKCYIQMELEIKAVPKYEKSTLKTYEFKRKEFFNGDLKLLNFIS